MLLHLPTPDALCSRGQNQYLMVFYKPHGDFLWRGSVLIISLGDVLNKQGYSSK